MFICIHMNIHVYGLNIYIYIYIANLVNKQEAIKRINYDDMT
jgi:hypothetical protein